MSRTFFALSLLACAPRNSPPPAPPYAPLHSPEAVTQCGAETATADTARENHLDSQSAERAKQAAQAVLALGDCERRQFDLVDISIDMGAARPQFQTTKNLYEESIRYGSGDLARLAALRLRDLHRAYADKLRKSHGNEVDDVVRLLEAEAKSREAQSLS